MNPLQEINERLHEIALKLAVVENDVHHIKEYLEQRSRVSWKAVSVLMSVLALAVSLYVGIR